MEITLCEAGSVSDGDMRQFELDGKSVLVCRTNGQLFAMDGICPHRGAQLAGGTLDGTTITCPWHEWTFDCQDGCGLTNPQAQLECYTVREVDGMLIVDIPDFDA